MVLELYAFSVYKSSVSAQRYISPHAPEPEETLSAPRFLSDQKTPPAQTSVFTGSFTLENSLEFNP